MARHDLVVIGASMGGVEDFSSLVSQLPRDFPAAVLMVLHKVRVVKALNHAASPSKMEAWTVGATARCPGNLGRFLNILS